MKDEILIFVYNANGYVWSVLIDFVHKMFSPATFRCSLCILTHNSLGMKKEWRKYTRSLGYKRLFVFKNDFKHLYPDFIDHQLPAIYLQKKTSTTLLISADELNSYTSLQELIIALNEKLAAL